MNVKYKVLDPAGNITVIVTTPVQEKDRRFAADLIMKTEKSAEQVGFLSGNTLDMAGGEFCGNATRCASFLTSEKEIICSGTKIKCEGTAAYIPKDLKGISHYIFENEIENPEERIKEISKGKDATGFMFWDEEKAFLKPLVYVPSIDTLFWEKSCASGTAALANYLCEKNGSVNLDVKEPGGILHIETSKDSPFVKLDGKIVLLKEGEICIPELNCL